MPDRNRATNRQRDLLRILTAETREELVKADGKAGLVLSCLGAALATLLGALTTGNLAPQHYSPLPQALFWAGCATWIPAFLFLGMVIAPRLGPSRAMRAHYFGDVNATRSTTFLADAVRRTDISDRDLQQLERLSHIVSVKYRCVRYGMLWSAAFVILTTAGFLLGTST
ncbi:Pycsar system effector family protein [Streptomyces sp. NPDC088197]|uniref:Pycsar system effector family protein n=1 Tax=Streptomyces sp. NPDC088197 TaxID=3365840 RepID=UPI00383066FA